MQIPDYELDRRSIHLRGPVKDRRRPGEIAIGIRRVEQGRTKNGEVELNPGRDERLQLKEIDELIVLSTYA